MELLIDKRVYSDECISKTVYSLSKNFIVNRTIFDKNHEQLYIESVGSDCDINSIRSIFLSALNDYKLRQIIENETHNIRTILYAKAFADLEDIDDENV